MYNCLVGKDISFIQIKILIFDVLLVFHLVINCDDVVTQSIEFIKHKQINNAR